MTIELSQQQQEAINLINSGHNVFLTGQAGTGKSQVIHKIKQTFKGEIALLAPTGMAASNIGGQTIHSFFKMGIDFGTTHRNKDQIMATDLIIIDEVSLITPELFACMNERLQEYFLQTYAYYDPNLMAPPFGGKQFLLVGDFYQLPPVIGGKETATLEHLICNSQDWQDLNITTVYLTKVFRQAGDDRFLDLLSRARVGKVTPDDVDLLNTRVKQPYPNEAVRIVYTNKRLKYINDQCLGGIDPAKMVRFSANYQQYPFKKDEIAKHIKHYQYEVELKVFVGAKVMMLKNNGSDYSNGSVGYVTKIIDEPLSDDGPRAAIFVLINGVEFEVNKVGFQTTDNKGNELSWAQFPLRLAYAITVHKAQGQTFEAVVIDRQHLSKHGHWYKFRPKNHGQLYTALSRARTLDGVFFEDEVVEGDFWCML